MNKQVEAVRVIPRIERWQDGSGNTRKNAALYLPDMRDDRLGLIGVYVHTGQSSMASLDYYAETKPPRSKAERAECEALLKEYKWLGGVECELKVLQRMPRR